MTINIPKTSIAPPDWFPAAGRPAWIPSTGQPSFDLNDIRWLSAVQLALGEAGSSTAGFRALAYIDMEGNSFIYLTFRLRFVQALDSANDSVFLGLHKRGSEEAIVIQMDAHSGDHAPGGLPSTKPPYPFFGGKLWKTGFDTGNQDWGPWQLKRPIKSALPRWLQDSAYTWLQSAESAVLANQNGIVDHDPNNRWAIQLVIPITTQPTVDDDLGPALGDDFDMWCLMRSALSTGAVVLHGENRTDGIYTSQYDLIHDLFPKPNVWDECRIHDRPVSSVPRVANVGARFNMHFAQAPLIEREVEIRGWSRVLYPPPLLDVYLALEKINLPHKVQPGANEGRFLENRMKRLIAQGGLLAEKLKNAQVRLSDDNIHSSDSRLESRLSTLHQALAEMGYSDRRGSSALHQLVRSLKRWLRAVRDKAGAAKQLASLFDALADWLLASDFDAAAKLTVFIAGLRQWSSSLNDDPASLELAPAVLQALREWLSTLKDDSRLLGPTTSLENWLNSDRGVKQLDVVLDELQESLPPLRAGDKNLPVTLALLAQGIARWLNGYERLDALVSALSDAGLTEDELDRLFPTYRVHVYQDTGERVTENGKPQPVLREQSSFGIYAYHDGSLEGWETKLQGATRIADKSYVINVPNDGTAKVNVHIQAVEPGDERLPEDTKDTSPREEPCGCLCQIFKLLNIGRKT
jgi:hypothetical protein